MKGPVSLKTATIRAALMDVRDLMDGLREAKERISLALLSDELATDDVARYLAEADGWLAGVEGRVKKTREIIARTET